MKLGIMKKVVAVAMTAAMVLGSISVTPPAEVMAENAAPAITAQAAKDKKGIKVSWNKLDDTTVTGYRVYRMVSDDNAEAIATLDNNGVSTKSWKFDFGPNEDITGEGENTISGLAEGYTSVSQENAYYTAEQGYGFTQGIPTAAGGTLAFINRTDGKQMSEDVLNGDFATIQAPADGSLTSNGKLEGDESYMEFVVDVPNGEYKVTATHSGYVTGRNISVFWFQGTNVGRHAVNNNTAISEKNITVTDRKLKVSASASASGGTVFPPALSALTITEVKEIPTGIDADGSLYCNDVTADLTKNYTYKVVAMKGDTEAADLSSGDITPVVAPTVSVGETTTTSAKLSINNNELVADSYKIYRKKAADASFEKVADFTDITGEGKYTADKIVNDKQVFVNDDFSTYALGSEANNRNLLVADNGDWTAANITKEWHTGMVADLTKDECMTGTTLFNATALTNYDGAFAYLAMGGASLTFHKKLTDAANLNGQTRLKLNFALPNFYARQDRGTSSSCLYLADKEIAEHDAANGYIAKIEYNKDDGKIYLNDSEIFAFATDNDAARSVWNTITLDINLDAKTISYEFEREAEEYVKSGSVTIPDAAQEPATQEGETEGEGEGDADEKAYATLSFTSTGTQPWGNIAIDNLKFASTETVDGPSRVYTYTDNNLEPNTEYNYYVGAVVGGKEVVKSSTANAKTQSILAESITLSKTSLELKKGDTLDLPTATVLPENASNGNVEWSSADTSVATIEQDGKVKGVGAGTTNIIATAKDGSGVTASCAVTVSAVTLNKTSLSLKVGEEQTLTATVRPTNITNKSVTWDSSDKNVATVDENGKVKAIAVGTTKITVTAANKGETATCTVRVTKQAVTGLTLNATSGTLKKGTTFTLKATIAPENATNKDVTWKSSNENVAKVTNGVVTAVAKGTAVITAASADNNTITATYNVTVTEPVTTRPATKVSIKKPSSTNLNKGKTLTLKAVMTPSNSTDKLTWKTSSKKIATVSNTGKVTGVGKGTATITVTTTSGKKATIKITVKIPAKKVKLSKSKVTLKKGKSIKIKAKLTPSNSTDKVTWKTNNKKVATVSKGKIKAKKKGKATITVKTTSGKSAKCKVTVK